MRIHHSQPQDLLFIYYLLFIIFNLLRDTVANVDTICHVGLLRGTRVSAERRVTDTHIYTHVARA